MAATLVWVVDTGSPNREHPSRHTPAPRSAARPSLGVRGVSSRPTFSTMGLPPRAVPAAMTAAHTRAADRPGAVPPPLRPPASRSRAMNFCPSCAPWRAAMAPAATRCQVTAEHGRRLSHRPAHRPPSAPTRRDRNSPATTLAQASALSRAAWPPRARAAPASPAIRAWLSLVGRPNRQASTAHTRMDSKAAHRAVSAASSPPGKTMRSSTVAATAGNSRQAIAAPRKLHPAASHTPCRKVREPEPTAVAMALGASVQPLTKMTASTSS